MSVKKSIANRKFYSLPENPNRVSKSKFSGGSKKREDIVKLVKYIDDNVIGKNSTFIGPYGRRKGWFFHLSLRKKKNSQVQFSLSKNKIKKI